MNIHRTWDIDCNDYNIILPLKFATIFFTFSKSSSLSYVLYSAVNIFQCTKYLVTPLIFCLFNTFSTFYFFSLLTFTSFSSFIFCSFTSSLYLTTWLIFTTVKMSRSSFEWIFIISYTEKKFRSSMKLIWK